MDKTAKKSKRQVTSEIDEAFGRITSAMASIDDPVKIVRLLGEVFTPTEIRDVALRWRIIELLHEGVPQRAIAERLGVSLCKITRGSRILKAKKSVAKSLIQTPKDKQNETSL